MSIALTSKASLDFVTLQNRINYEESEVLVRLTSLVGKTESGVSFNAHIYKSVDDGGLPLSKLFLVPEAESAIDDPMLKMWLSKNSDQRIICVNKVYISNVLVNIAVVGTPD